MFLRSLTLRGFKSFADKTVLDFTPGISVIVGPNGSGKSNLVDAISWVLGEQGARALRGNQMADVIFAGSPVRPALGMAEVRLVIDNTSGLIPLPLSEIEISRAIFRSGQSEYRIGGQACRLLDIQELLSETGMGRALHTVVGQGQLEEVLTARPEDRRQYIEEAAGVAKHRRRKERAQRKLVGLEQDLLRLQDVLGELRRQLKPLKEQAEMARRHERLTSEAGDLASRVAAARLRELYRERDRRREGWEQGLAVRAAARERLHALDGELTRLGQARARTAATLDETEALLQGAQRDKSEAEVALRHSVAAESDARARLAQETLRTARLSRVDEDIARLDGAVAETTAALVEREAELASAEQVFQQAERARREAEEERRRMADEAVAHRAEVETLRRSLASYERERERLIASGAELRARIARAEAEREGLEAEVERLDGESTPLSVRRARLESERRVLAAEVEELEEALRDLGSRVALLEARRADIEETPGTRFLSSHRGRAVGLLRDLVRPQPGMEQALAAALGPLADAVVYADEDTALADAGDGLGAVLAAPGAEPPASSLPEERPLLSALRVDDRVRSLASVVLADVYLATDLEEATRKHRAHRHTSFVTPDGILVGPAFIRTAPRTHGRAGEIRRELQAAERDLAATRALLRPKRARLDELHRGSDEVGEAMDGIDALITAAAERMGRLRGDLASLRKEEELLAERLAGLEEAAAGWREALATAGPTRHEASPLPSVPEPPVIHRVEVETLRRERSRADAALARLRKERQVLGMEDPEALRSALARAKQVRADREAHLQRTEVAVAEAGRRREAAATEDREASEREAAANRSWRDASGELERLREKYEAEDRLQGDLERRIREGEKLLRDGHGRDPVGAVSALDADETADGLERRADVVARRLALLGRVNLLAGGEFDVLQERHDFLARELDDVKRARRDLVEVIRRVDGEVISLFDAAFRDVATEFEALFADLFPGGEGRLMLTDPADLLTTGVEVEARPGRKRVKRISLLSGGERALVALAFLFAIFRARPSPFYLLDEVEPALDDVNLSRFLRLINGFAESSQVLVVTHQKRTMEVADILYGVSMGRDSSSAVISQRMAPAASDSGPSSDSGSLRVPESDSVR
jgi:chromosome segregation protein